MMIPDSVIDDEEKLFLERFGQIPGADRLHDLVEWQDNRVGWLKCIGMILKHRIASES